MRFSRPIRSMAVFLSALMVFYSIVPSRAYAVENEWNIATGVGEAVVLQNDTAQDPVETDPVKAELEGTEPAGTEPEGTEPEGTEPEGTEPEGTEPEGTEPEGTEPEGTEPEGTEPEGTEPEGTEPEGTEPEGTEPEGTEPEGTESEGTEPEETEPEETEPEEPAQIVYQNGTILIYTYSQLKKIGSGDTLMSLDNELVGLGEPVIGENGNAVTYSLSAQYAIVWDISLPFGTRWNLPEGFTGRIAPQSGGGTGTLYNAATDTIYLYHPYQLLVMEMEDAEKQPVLSNDAVATQFGMGNLIYPDGEENPYLTYGPLHNYVISARFCSDMPMLSYGISRAAENGGLGGQDFDGQVLKTIDGTQYIMLGNEAQLRVIGTDTKVYTRAYDTKYNANGKYYARYDDDGNPIMLYGGDADYQIKYNGYVDTTFQNPKDHDGTYTTGVNQQTGAIIEDYAATVNGAYKTDVKYGADAKYIIFRDIPLTQGLWNLSDEFTGEIQPAVIPESRTLYEVDESGHVTIYVHNPLQLNRMNMPNAAEQPVYENDAYAEEFRTGEQVTVNGTPLTYSTEHSYVLSQHFSSDIPENASLASNDIWGRDFPGQVLKTINGKQYILIGNDQQLRAIGTDQKVYGAVYQTIAVSERLDVHKDTGEYIMRYPGDADLSEDHNGYGDFTFGVVNDADKNISDGSSASQRGKAGVNQETGEINVKLDEDVRATYSSTANYIIFRDIGLNNEAWKPLMFSGEMIGAESPRDYTPLWDKKGSNATAITVTARPTISDITVVQSEAVEVTQSMGVGFFATITNEYDTANIGVIGDRALVSNLELHNVNVSNETIRTNVNQTVVSGLLSLVGGLLGGVLDGLLWILTIGNVKLNLNSILSDLLNARANDPSALATGAFAGRVVGNVLVDNCAVTGTVEVHNVNNYTGGFVGYMEGATEYDGLSAVLGGVVDVLSSLLNVIPGLGLGDLITILLGNVIDLGTLIPTGYVEPKITNSSVSGLTGTVGNASGTAKDYIGGFVGQEVGALLVNNTISDSNYTVKSNSYGGGFAGVARDAEVEGTLGLNDLVNVDAGQLPSFQTQSLLMECDILNSNVRVEGVQNLGGFAGVLANSYAINSTMTGSTLVVEGKNSDASTPAVNVGGFAGRATLGWGASFGGDTAKKDTLLGTVGKLLTGLLGDTESGVDQQLLSLVGVAPSAILGCQMDYDSITVHGDDSYVGGMVGRGDGLILGKSDEEYVNELSFWKYGNAAPLADSQKRDYCSIDGLSSVSSGGDYVGGVAGFMGTASAGGLLDSTLGLARFIGFTADGVLVNGVDGGYTVSADGVSAGGGFGMAVGGMIDNVQLNKLQSVTANNRAGGFVGVSGPGDLANTGGLKVSLLGLDILEINNLLAIGQGVEVEITDSTVTGIDEGFTVTATGSNADGEIIDFTAAGFIAESNSTEIQRSHVYNLKQVIAADTDGYAGGFVGTSETGGLADVADEESLLELIKINGLVDAVGYMIPKYVDCTVSYVDGGGVQADVAGGFAADFQSGTVNNADRNDGDHYSVYNIDHVNGQSYAGGFGGKVYSGALAEAGGGLSILGSLNLVDLSINVSDLLGVVEAYVPFVEYAGVYSENGFTVSAPRTSETDINSGAAGGFIGWASGAQVSHCDVNRLKHTTVTPPDDLEAVEAPSYFNGESAYAVMGGRYAGGFVGNMDIGSAASLGGGLSVLGQSIQLTNVLDALSVVVTTVEHSDVYGGPGGFAVLSDGIADGQTVGMAGGFAGNISGGHVQNSNVHNFSYIIGEIAAGGYVGNFVPGNVANVLNDTSILGSLVNLDSALASVAEDFVPTIRNSSTDCVPCGGAVRAHAPSDASVQRGMAGGYVGHNEGGHIWGLHTERWKEEATYSGPTSICKAERIRSVYGYEYAGGFTGLMECADTAQAGGLSILGGLIQVGNLLGALSVVYPTEENTAIYGPLANLDVATWNSWVEYVGQYGGYGAELAAAGPVSTQEQLDAILQDYVYGYHVVAGRSVHETILISEGGDAGGYVGLMKSGTITNGQAYDAKLVRAMRSTGGFAGKMLTGGAAEFGTVNLLGIIKLNLGELLNMGQVFVPVIKNSTVRGYRAGLTVLATGTDHVHGCGYAGGYAGSVYGGQIWGETTGCDVSNLLRVRGTNSIGGYVGLATAATVASANTNASSGLLQGILDLVIGTPGDLLSVMDATVTTIRGAKVSAADAEYGFIVDGEYEIGTYANYAGGFAGALEAAVLGEEDGGSKLTVEHLRNVDGGLYAGGFFGLADVSSVATVSGSGEAGETTILGFIKVGQTDVLSAFRTYVYHADVIGVPEGIRIRANRADQEGLLDSTRYMGCAGGFGGGLMNGSVKDCTLRNLNTVEGLNYVGGFIGHMGKNGAVDLDGANVGALLGLQAGVLDVFGSHVDDCTLTGIGQGIIVRAQGGQESVAGGFVGYADVSRINDSVVTNQKKVVSDQISGGFIGKTNRSYLVDVDADSPLLAVILYIVNALLDLLHVGDLENVGIIDLEIPGLESVFELNVLADGNLLYVNLLGIRIGVSLSSENGQDRLHIHIGDSEINLNYVEGKDITNEDIADAQIKLFKGNRTEVNDCSVTGISLGYDVFGGGATDDADGAHEKGHSGGFVGLNREGRFQRNQMYLCDTVRGTTGQVGPFSGTIDLSTVYDSYTIDDLEGVEGKTNTYRVYREDGVHEIIHLAIYRSFQDWEGDPLNVYRNAATAVLMNNSATQENPDGLVPEPGEIQDPCEQTLELTIQKIWKDWNDWDHLRPEQITVTIYQHYTKDDGNPETEDTVTEVYGESVILTKEDTTTFASATWRVVVSGLPVAFREMDSETGEEHIYYYSYSVDEAPVAGYETTIVFDSREQVATITNTHQPELPFTGAGGDVWYVGLGVAMTLLGTLKKKPRRCGKYEGKR